MSDLAAVPEGSWLRGILRRNLRSLAGLGLLILLAAIAVALATWNINDPSLSNAVDGPAQNILGYAGAVIADLAMQIFGIAALLLILPPVFWGWRLLVGAPTRFRRITIPTWLGATLIGAGAIATLPVSANWPLPTGLGGIAGDLILRVPSALFGAIGGVASFLTDAILVILTALLWLHTAGFLPWSRNFLRDEESRLVVPARTRRRARAAPVIDDDLGFEEEDPDERNSVVTLLFGAVAHIGYRLRSSLSRLKRRGNISDADYLDPEERYDPESELASEDSLLAPDEDFPATDDEIVEVAPRHGRLAARCTGDPSALLSNCHRSTFFHRPARVAGTGRQRGTCWKKTLIYWNRYSTISAYAARSSISGRDPWSRFTSLNRRRE